MSTTEILPPGFDYRHVGDDLAVDLRALARRIRDRMAASVIETGRELLRVKDHQLDHGQFIAWVEAECALSPRTAQRMMAAAEWAEGKNDTVSHLPPTVIYVLSAPSTPANVEQEMMARIEAGEGISLAAVKNEISAAKQEAARAAKRIRMTPEQKAAVERQQARRRKKLEKQDRERHEQDERRQQACEALIQFLIAQIADQKRFVELLEAAQGHIGIYEIRRALAESAS
jgi:hypothetical protein